MRVCRIDSTTAPSRLTISIVVHQSFACDPGAREPNVTHGLGRVPRWTTVLTAVFTPVPQTPQPKTTGLIVVAKPFQRCSCAAKSNRRYQGASRSPAALAAIVSFSTAARCAHGELLGQRCKNMI